MTDDFVYRTRIVNRDFARSDRAINHFWDPDEAKRYLETYIEEQLDAVPAEWRREESADQKWSMGIAPKQGHRAVVMGCPVHDSADEPISKMRETLEALDRGDRIETDGGHFGGQSERRDPADDPRACSRCGVHIGLGGGEYCDSCAREIGTKPPMERCMGCGQDAPREQMESVDISPPDEYYPRIRYLCQGCSSDTESESP